MRRCTYFVLIACFFCLVFCNDSSAQLARGDSSSQQNALNNTLTFFYASVGRQSPLYNGTEYYSYDPTMKGNAYYSDVNAFTPGSVFYDKVLFTGVPMLYDIYSDNLVVLLYNHFTKFALIKQKVASFDLLGHHFVNIDSATLAANSVVKPGFYDELYKGKIQVLAKSIKDIQTTTGGADTGPQSYFNPGISYFIKKNGIYYNFSGQGSLLDILKDKRKELQQYIRSSQLKFRKSPEEAMVKIAAYYDHLTN